ncbi:MAG: sugar phosphate isomerase/epimerase [Chloroflexi bacterium]|nr:sugar phosphate isomerase/epimerase [Chloroflexota bacterium]
MYRALSTGAIGVAVSFEEKVRLAAAYGFRGVDVGMPEIERLGLKGVRSLLAQNHILPAVTGLPVNFREDDASFERDMEKLPEFVRTLTDLGCTRSATWIMPTLKEGTFAAAFEQLRSRTARICEVMAPFGMRYGLEFVGPQTLRAGKPEFIYDQKGMLELIKATGAKNLGLLLDCFHWYTSHGTAQELAQLTDDLIILVHVNDAFAGRAPDEQIDSQRALPGETGVIDMAVFMGALNKMAYSGPVIVEPFSPWLSKLTPDEAVKKVQESLDKIWTAAN